MVDEDGNVVPGYTFADLEFPETTCVLVMDEAKLEDLGKYVVVVFVVDVFDVVSVVVAVVLLLLVML